MLNYLPLPILVLEFTSLIQESKTTLSGKQGETKTEKTTVENKVLWTAKLIFRKSEKNIMEIRIKEHIAKIDLTNPYGSIDDTTDLETIERLQAILSQLWSVGINGIKLLSLKKSGFLTQDFDLSPLIMDKIFNELTAEGYAFNPEEQLDNDLVDRYLARQNLGLKLETKYFENKQISASKNGKIKGQSNLTDTEVTPITEQLSASETTLDVTATPVVETPKAKVTKPPKQAEETTKIGEVLTALTV